MFAEFVQQYSSWRLKKEEIMPKRLVLFLILLISLVAKRVLANDVAIDTSIYPPEQLVWLRIHDHSALLPKSILDVHASFVQREYKITRVSGEDTVNRAVKTICNALHRALSDIDTIAQEGQFGDWSYILPTHELREWYALVVLHDQMKRALIDNDQGAAAFILLRTLFEAYVCKLSDTNPPYIIITDRKRMLDVLRSLT